MCLCGKFNIENYVFLCDYVVTKNYVVNKKKYEKSK